MLAPMGVVGAADRELQPGDTLGPYRLDAVLGEGGMGLVFKATHEADNRQVALKVLKRDLTGDFVFQQRFRQEARAAAEVHEPHLVKIIEAAEADGRHYLACDYVDGGSLADRFADSTGLPLDQVVSVVADVSAGLDALHGAGVVHRDIKPSNVLFDQDGMALLTDFGLAKGRAYTVLTRPGQVMGTLDYLAPELIRGNPATPATDIYALGCLAYECVAGKAPFADKGVFQVGIAHLEEEPPDPAAGRDDVSAEFSAAVLTALAKDPEARPSSAGAYAGLLRTVHSDRETT
jgi:serine/threonine protein kinase